MASLEDHMSIDRRHLGEAFPLVHRWLDEFYRTHGGLHREKRHHREGVEEVRDKWGDDAGRAAELHILTDMGHVPTRQKWETRNSSKMDAMGRRSHYLRLFDNCDDLQMSIAYWASLPCHQCGHETEQRLVGVDEGRFFCRKCRTGQVHSDYRLKV